MSNVKYINALGPLSGGNSIHDHLHQHLYTGLQQTHSTAEQRPPFSAAQNPLTKLHQLHKFTGAHDFTQRYDMDSTRAYQWSLKPSSQLPPDHQLTNFLGARPEYTQASQQDGLLAHSFPNTLSIQSQSNWDCPPATYSVWGRDDNSQLRPMFPHTSHGVRASSPGSDGSSPESSYRLSRDTYAYDSGISQISNENFNDMISHASISPSPEMMYAIDPNDNYVPPSANSVMKSCCFRRRCRVKTQSKKAKKLFHCTQCDKEFTRAGDLRRHEQSKHHTHHTQQTHHSRTSSTSSSSSSSSLSSLSSISSSTSKAAATPQVRQNAHNSQSASRPLARHCPDPQCSTVSRLDNLPKHVERRHPDVWRAVPERNPHAIWYDNCVAFCKAEYAGTGCKSDYAKASGGFS